MGGERGAFVVKCKECGAKNRVRTVGRGKLPVCGKCGAAIPPVPNIPEHFTDANFEKSVLQSDLPVLVDMWAAWCGPCRLIAPVIESLAAEYAGSVVVGKLDVDANQRVASQYKVRSIPTLLIFQNGREIDRMVGLQTKEAIVNKIAKFSQ